MAIASTSVRLVSSWTARAPCSAARVSSSASRRRPSAEAAGGGGDPHPLDVGGAIGVQLHAAAADGFAVQAGDDEEPVRQPHLVDAGGQAAGGVEAGVEALVELGEVGGQAVLGVGVAGSTTSTSRATP